MDSHTEILQELMESVDDDHLLLTVHDGPRPYPSAHRGVDAGRFVDMEQQFLDVDQSDVLSLSKRSAEIISRSIVVRKLCQVFLNGPIAGQGNVSQQFCPASLG
jgi:hypothetical protein